MPKGNPLSHLMQLMGECEHEEEKIYPSFDGQRELLKDFLAYMPEFKVGDYVIRNPHGKRMYNAPNDKQLAMIVEVFDGDRADSDGAPVHGLMAVVYEKGKIITHTINFRYFEKAE